MSDDFGDFQFCEPDCQSLHVNNVGCTCGAKTTRGGSVNDQERAERAKDALALAEFRIERMNAGDPKYAHCDPDELIPLRDVARDSLSAQSEVAQLKAELRRLTEALEDFAEHGLRADLIPTHDLNECEEFWHGYIRRINESVKERAAAALSEAPATEGSGENG